MRIAIASDWYAPRRGGIEAQLWELASRLQQRGHVVDVLTSTPDAVVPSGVGLRGVRAARLPGADVVISPFVLGEMERALDRGYDVVHAHASVVSPVAYASAVAARRLGLPTALSFHSVLHFKRWALRAADALFGVSRRALAWTGVSDLVTSQLRSALPGARVETLSNGADIGFWRGASSRATPPVTIVSVSRLHSKKRAAALVRAFARARASLRVPVTLKIFGEGPEERTIRQLIQRLGVERGDHHVELHGWVSREELRSTLAASRAFALASRNESFGIAALEAAASGIPVIAMRASGSTEFLRDGENACLCDTDDDLSAALVRVAAFDSATGHLHCDPSVLSRYDWPAVISRHEALYSSLIDPTTPAAAAARSA
jgi:glycosyltransferase involved in cell wall biosynthesis